MNKKRAGKKRFGRVLAVMLAVVMAAGLWSIPAAVRGDDNTYTVIWANWDGTVLETDENVPEGTLPVYDGETPEKHDNTGTYSFIGWQPEVTEVTEDVTYIAQYQKTENDILWRDGDVIEACDIIGGTEDDPVNIYVQGTVTLNGRVSLTSGYFNILPYPETDARIISNVYDSGYTFYFGGQVSMKNITLDGANGNHGDVYANGGIQTYSGGIFDSCIIQNFEYTGIYIPEGSSGLTLKDTYVIGCKYYGLQSYENGIVIENSTFRENGTGVDLRSGYRGTIKDITVTNNKIGFCSSISRLSLEGCVFIAENTDENFNVGNTVPRLSGALKAGSFLMLTGISVTGPGELVLALADETTGYTVTEEDASYFWCSPTAAQTEGGITFGEVSLNSSGQIVTQVNVSTVIHWQDGQEIESTVISGGTADSPVTVYVDGTVTIKEPVSFSGYVNILPGTEKEAVIISEVYSSDHTISVGGVITMTDITIDGDNGNTAYAYSGIKFFSGGSSLINCRIRNTQGLGIYLDNYASGITLTDCTVFGCQYKGIESHGNNLKINNCTFDNNNVGLTLGKRTQINGITVTGNKIGLQMNASDVSLQGLVVVSDNTESNVIPYNVIYLAGPLSEGSIIKTTASAEAEGETVIAEPYNNYQITDSDVQAIVCELTKGQADSGMTVGEPYLNEEGKVAVLVSTPTVYIWNDGDVIEGMTLTGGTEDNPAILYVCGTVTLKGTVATTGYINIMPGENAEAILISEIFSNDYTLSLSSGTVMTDITLQGSSPSYSGNAWNGISMGAASLISCTIKDFQGFGVALTGGGLLKDCTVSGCEGIGAIYMLNGNGGTYENCTFTGNGTAIQRPRTLKSVTITGNKTGIMAYDQVYLEGKIIVKDNTSSDYYIANPGNNYLRGPLEEGSNINLSNLGLSNLGQIVLVRPMVDYPAPSYEPVQVYTITAQDAACFHYTPTAEQQAGNGDFGQPRLNKDGTIVIEVFYKTTFSFVDPELQELLEHPTDPENPEIQVIVESVGDNELPVIESSNGTFELVQGSSNKVRWILSHDLVYKDGKLVVESVIFWDGETSSFQKIEAFDGERLDLEFLINADSPKDYKLELLAHEPVKVYGSSLTLNGEIGVNFYLDIPDTTAEVANVNLQYKGTTVTYKVSDETRVSAGETADISRYKFTLNTVAKEMHEPITLTVTDENGNLIPLLNYGGTAYYDSGYVYSVSQYFEDAKVSTDPQITEKLLALINAMDMYGRYAQLYFKYDTASVDTATLASVDDVTSETVAPYAAQYTGTEPAGLDYIGSSLVLESRTEVRFFFTLYEGYSIDDYLFTINGEEVTPVKYARVNWGIDVPDIPAKKLGESITVNVKTKNGTGNGYTIVYYPLSYTCGVLSRESIYRETEPGLVELAQSLYKYYAAADAYFER